MKTIHSMMKVRSCPYVFSSTIVLLWITAMLISGVYVISAQAAIPFMASVRQIQESKIKVIATVESIEILDKHSGSYTNKITFKLEKCLSAQRIPKEFTGHRIGYSGHPIPGPWGFSPGYVKIGARVFVTIRDLGKEITSYTPMTSELYKALLNDCSRVVVNSTDRSSVTVAEDPNDPFTKECRVFKDRDLDYKSVIDY